MPLFIAQLHYPQNSILKTCGVLDCELSNGFRLPSRDGMKVVEGLVCADVFTVGQVGITVEDALHIRGLSSSSQDVAQEVRRWLRLVRERLSQRLGKGFSQLVVRLGLIP